MAGVKILSPKTESELLTAVALLEAHEIRCFVQNGVFGALFPGPEIDLHNKRWIIVAEEDEETARELVKEFNS